MTCVAYAHVLQVILPDESLSSVSHEDAVLVLDPYPEANFGHLIVIFYISTDMSRASCLRQGGHFIGKLLHVIQQFML